MSNASYQNIHLLLPKGDLQALKRQAKSKKKSVAELIRDAVRQVYGGAAPNEKKRVFERLARCDDLAVDDWESMKKDLLARYE